jgi:hypothetical protein
MLPDQAAAQDQVQLLILFGSHCDYPPCVQYLHCMRLNCPRMSVLQPHSCHTGTHQQLKTTALFQLRFILASLTSHISLHSSFDVCVAAPCCLSHLSSSLPCCSYTAAPKTSVPATPLPASPPASSLSRKLCSTKAAPSAAVSSNRGAV